MKDLKSIFEKAKAGDVIGFVIKGDIKQMPIQIATQGEYTHVAIIVKIVSKRDDEIIFYIAEQTLTGGCLYRRIEITKTNLASEFIYTTEDSYFKKQEVITLASLERELTNDEKEKLEKYVKDSIGKKYGLFTLFFGFEFLEKIMPRFLEKRINKIVKKKNKVCSTYVTGFFELIGFTMPNDFFFSPSEVINLSFFKKC